MDPKIILKRMEDIQPYANNPRLNEKAVDAVADSIRRYGFKQPVVLDKNNVIVVGHTRYLAARQIGMDILPCIISELDDVQNREYRLADNKTNELARWDFDKLATELEGLDLDVFQFDWSFPPGIDEAMLDSFFSVPESIEEKAEEPAVYGVKVCCGTQDEAKALFAQFTEQGYEVEML